MLETQLAKMNRIETGVGPSLKKSYLKKMCWPSLFLTEEFFSKTRSLIKELGNSGSKRLVTLDREMEDIIKDKVEASEET